MSIVPSGSPIWTRTAVHTQYGGDVNKRNLLSVGVVDAQTDVGAEEIARLSADLSALANTSPFAVITYLNNDASPAAPTILKVYGQIGVITSSYSGNAPPTGFPSAVRNGNDDVTFTFASSYTDPYGVSGSFAPMGVILGIAGSSARVATYEQPTSTTVRVHVFHSSTGAAGNDDTVTMTVW